MVLGAISIIPNENGRLGFVTHEDDSDFTAEGGKNRALTCLAGYTALVAIDAPNADSGCDGDFHNAQEALEPIREVLLQG